MVVADQEMTSKPHVAVICSPGLGHTIPLLEFSKLLVFQHGFHVTFLAMTTTEPSAALDELLRSPSLPPGLRVLHLSPVDVSSAVPPDSELLTKISLIAQHSLRSLSSVLQELNPKPRALVIDLFCTDAFQICKPLSIPVYSFLTTNATFMAFSLFLPTLDSEVSCEFVDLAGVQAPGCTMIRACDLDDQIKNRKSDEYKWLLHHVNRFPMAAGFLENSWEDLEPISFRAVAENLFYRQIPTPPVYPVGPVIKKEEPESFLNNECLAWLDRQPEGSVLYVSLGSGGTLTGEQLAELAWGLELSQQRFLWVVRNPSNACASGTYFSEGSDVNDPKTYLPEGFLKRTEEMGLVVPSWAPQVAVLGHPATGAFLSHCGWNSTLESMANGVAMVAWPLYAEQRMNAAMLAEEAGVAVRPEMDEKGVYGREEIERVVRMVLESEEGKMMSRKAKEYKESAASTLGVGGSSYNAVSCLAMKWRPHT